MSRSYSSKYCSKHQHYSPSSRSLFQTGYGLFVWQSNKRKKYCPGDRIEFNRVLAKVNEKLSSPTEIVVKTDGLYRITWSLNTAQRKRKQPRIHAIGRVLINGCPLDQSYSYQLLTSPSLKLESYDSLKGKHALQLKKGDRISVQNHPESVPIELINDLNKNVVSAWVEVEKVAF